MKKNIRDNIYYENNKIDNSQNSKKQLSDDTTTKNCTTDDNIIENLFKNLNQKSIVEGFILSEIFGKPLSIKKRRY